VNDGQYGRWNEDFVVDALDKSCESAANSEKFMPRYSKTRHGTVGNHDLT
jgi:hypothetical protein